MFMSNEDRIKYPKYNGYNILESIKMKIYRIRMEYELLCDFKNTQKLINKNYVIWKILC